MSRRAFRVMLINPAPERMVQGGWYRMPLLGLGYLASSLREEGVDCCIVDMKFSRLGLDHVVAAARDYRPDLAGFTAMTHEVVRAAECAAALKRSLPGVRSVIGGAHATALPEETLAQFPAFDSAVFGEGERTLVELALSLQEDRLPTGVAGTAYRDGQGAIRKNDSRPWNEDINALPFPAWDLYPAAREYQIYSSRGCPYRCIFCMRVLGDRVRFRSVESVVAEFRWLVERHAPREISFSDETFTLDRERTEAICDALIREGLHRRTRWFANTHAHGVSGDLFKKMRAAGCVRVGVGIESGNEEVLERIRKGITRESASRTVAAAKEAGLEVAAFFIIGHPRETIETIRETIDFAVELNPASVAFGNMVPYPGTEVAAMARRGEGGYSIRSTDWNDYNKYFGSALDLNTVSRRDIERWQARAYLCFYIRTRRFVSLLGFLFSRWRSVCHFIGRRLWHRN